MNEAQPGEAGVVLKTLLLYTLKLHNLLQVTAEEKVTFWLGSGSLVGSRCIIYFPSPSRDLANWVKKLACRQCEQFLNEILK